MAGPAPIHQPTFTAEQVATCRALIRRPSAPQAQVQRARLVLLLAEDAALDSEAAGRRLGKHANWVRFWRRIWAGEGFRLTDRPGRGRKPRVSPPAAGDGGRVGLRTADRTRPAPQPLQHR
jgi:hypothetical protein